MASWLVLSYLALCSLVLFSTATGTTTLSVDREYSCPGTKVIFTCVVNTTVLSWDIDFLNSNDINRVSFYSRDSTERQFMIGQGTVYTFNLTSNVPLISTMSTIASAELSGATISCQDGHTISAHVETVAVDIMQDPQRPSNVMPLIPNDHDAAGVLNISLEWDDGSDTDHENPSRTRSNQISSYTITVDPSTATSGSIFITNNTSIPLALHYDRDYNISVMASNCVGNSTPAQIHIRLVHCGSSVGKDVSSTEGNPADKLKTYCLQSQSGFNLAFSDTPEETNPEPDKPTEFCSQHDRSVSEILIPALITSHLLLSSCALIIGLLLGFMSHRCCKGKAKSSVDKKIAEEPVYSEIPSKVVPPVYHVSELVKSVDNVAYGQVSP